MEFKVTFLRKTMLIVLLIILSTTVFAQDSDNDGVLDATENIDGTDPFDTCSYVVASITEPISFKDCDADGLADSEEITGIDDAGTTANPNGYITNPLKADTDGDGVIDGTEVTNGYDPTDFCSFSESDVTLAGEQAFLDADCDGDGVKNSDEINNTDLNNPCDFNLSDITLTPTTFCNINEITGNVRFDMDSNGCSTSDINIENVKIIATNGTRTFSTFTQADGSYSLFTDTGNYSISVESLPSYFTTSPNTYSYNFFGSGENFTANFCVTTSQTINDVTVNVIPLSSPRPGFTATYRILYKNNGTTTLNGNANFEYDNTKLTVQNTSETIDSQTGNSISFNYTNLLPFESRFIDVSFLVATIPTVSIGDLVSFTATVNPISGDHTISNNTLVFNDIIIGSYDPNDIHVLEGYSIKLNAANDFLHYTVRFQNTGTANAINVLVTNKLDDNLDWSSFQLESTSHTGRVAIFDHNQIEFIFENIQLPDYTSNEPNSHGFISYKVKPKNSIIAGDEMANKAAIFFDFNPAIITNTVNTTIESTATVTNESFSNLVSIFPNPADNRINIKVNDQKIIKVMIYSKLGQLIATKTESNISYINTSSLSSGLYLLKLEDEKGNIAIKKMILK